MIMKIPISIHLEKIVVKVAPTTRPIKDIVGFAEIEIEDNQGKVAFKVRGCTIKVKSFRNSPTFTVNAPAYKSGFGYKTSFIIENVTLWHEVEKTILREFHEKNGGLSPEDYLNSEEEVNSDEIAKIFV